MASFRLLHFPPLVLIEVFEHMTVLEILELSQASKKAAQFISAIAFSIFKLSVAAYPEFGAITINSKRSYLNIYIHNLEEYLINPELCHRYGNERIPISHREDENVLDTFYPNFLQGLFVISSYLSKLFKCPKVETVQIELGLRSDLLFQLIDWITERQNGIDQLAITNQHEHKWRNEKSVEKNVENILDKLKVTQQLSLDIKLTPSFDYPFQNVPEEMSIRYSEWFKKKEHFDLPFKKLWLDHSSLDNKYFRHLVKRWMKGEYPLLKHFVVFTNEIDENLMIGGFYPPIFDQSTQLDADKVKSIAGNLVGIEGSVEIQTKNGIKGQLLVRSGESGMFSLFVCD